MQKIEKTRFYELDVMRFLAALAVLFYHYTFASNRMMGTPFFGIEKISRYGYLGVDVFFMISGYVVLMSSMHKTPKYFVISRITRLYPAYWICCLFTFVFLYFGNIHLQGSAPTTFKLLAVNLTMFQEFLGKENLNGVFWTLTYELGFYFIILAFVALKLWRSLLMIILLWLLYTLSINLDAAKNAFSFFLIPKYSCCFIAGMLFYLWKINYAEKWKLIALLILCFTINIKNDVWITADMNNFYQAKNLFNTYIVIACVCCFYLFFSLSATNKLNFNFLRRSAHLGKLTYPLYLVHGFGVGFFLLWGNLVNKYVILVMATSFSLLLSFLIYKFVEEKFRLGFKRALLRLSDKI
ncbi:peptidoglycan/LPS O-acetylase OafA/YrhL [Pedobacter sp. UYP30]|uniref:acyltransferase family protein n=1 Tax=Pedobacter sp. UYP30 TaxID=1756400 RepID=UPI00339390F4